MRRGWLLAVALCLLLCVVHAQNVTDPQTNSTDDDGSFASDPILQYRPSFSCSLPIQILMTGIVLTLASVLLVHLVFTGQYHWPLAPVNYALQVSAVITLLISLVATLRVVLQTATEESRQWPYMLNYIAVDIPPLRDLRENSGWSTGELAAWLLMNATTSALIQITHIQFLTLLFPSRLERRLIFVLLGPLAIVAAIMQLVPMNDSSSDGKLTSIASAIQNVCNATLSLLFTASLFIWGFFVNRKQAWRTDGGTAAFGAGALVLAIASTAITFVYIPGKDQYNWMPGLMWAVILWQSFLGWWWWVGAGMGVGEVDELLRREEKRRRKRKVKMEARRARKEKAQTFWRGVAGAFSVQGRRETSHSEAGIASSRVRSATRSTPASDAGSQRPRSPITSIVSAPFSGTTTDGVLGRVRILARYGYGWYLSLRHAHLTAARVQAEENVEKIQQVYGKEGAEVGDPAAEVGWGLGHFGIRQMRDVDDTEREEGLRGILEENRSDTGEWVDDHEEREGAGRVTSAASSEGGLSKRRTYRIPRSDTDGELPEPKPSIPDSSPTSMWYWGPLRRWRLQDTTIYT